MRCLSRFQRLFLLSFFRLVFEVEALALIVTVVTVRDVCLDFSGYFCFSFFRLVFVVEAVALRRKKPLRGILKKGPQPKFLEVNRTVIT